MSRVAGTGIGPADAPVADTDAASRQLEATFLRQMLSASGAFKPSEVAGGQLRADMFIEALADAVAKGGGIGIARLLRQQMGDGDEKGADGKRGAVSGGGDALPADVLAEAEAEDGVKRTAQASGFARGLPKGITSGFGQRVDPIQGGEKFHQGIDLRAAAGDAIHVAGEGVVRRAGPRGDYGNAVEVDHGGGVTTLYAHASEVLVSAGQKVSAGQEIARVGQSGRATGPHLHFEVRQGDRQVDPTPYAGVVHRALNAYQKRAEDSVVGKLGSHGGDGP